MDTPLRILIVATKPPWPPVDGGRVVVHETLKALSSVGHAVTLVAPVDPEVDVAVLREELSALCRPELVPARPRDARIVAAVSLLRRRPVTVVRHALPAIRRRVAELVAVEAVDVVQAEQLQAVAQAAPAASHGIPVVHRAHNVESALWSYAASFGGPLAARLLAREARRLSHWERRVMGRVAATVALTEIDVGPLEEVSGGRSPVRVVPVPYPAQLEAGRGRLDGRPPVVTLASPTWLPSLETVQSIAADWWPEVRDRLPEAVLHVYGGVPGVDGDGVRWHGAPRDSAEAFVEGAAMAIPARHPTGVPIKALEAWARGLPLVVSSETAAALGTVDGDGVAVADGARALADTLARIQEDPGYRESLVVGGRRVLASRHDPSRVASELVAVYGEVAARRG